MEAIPPPYPLLSGTWFFSAYEPGKGPLVGEVEIEKSGQDYVTSAKIRTPNGSIEERQGRAVLYTGYSWRGSSSGSHLGDMKEVLMLADDGSRLTGRFFKGVYGELGIDVELSRIGKDARVTAVWPRGLRADVGDTSLTILGANLPINLAPGDVVLGHGLEVQEITSTTSNALEVRVAVSGDVPVGSRDVSLGDAVLVDAFAVYDQMDYVKVEPEEGMARLGGVQIPKQFVQFEAVGYHDGPDDERFTEDDINLGLVNATWHLEEYIIREDDDDLKYVGAIDDNGFFTPNIEGALLHGPEQIADLPVPVAESPGAVRIGHPERSHLVEYLAPNSVFNSLPRQRSSPHLRPDDRLVTIDRVLHHASLGVA